MRNLAQKVSEIPCITQGEHKTLGEGKNDVFSFNIKKVSPIRLICIGCDYGDNLNKNVSHT